MAVNINGGPPDQTDLFSKEYAQDQDSHDPLCHLRDEFLLPTKQSLRSRRLAPSGSSDASDEPCIYLCGNSLGPQPKRTAQRIQQYLATWAQQGVFGHFKPLDASPLPTWLDADDHATKQMAPIVGAHRSEVAVMETLTANLHLLMSAFYRPDPNRRHKILLESKAFPSDHFAVESQIRQHGLDPSTSMVSIEPESDSTLISTDEILASMNTHASTTALILLPGIQFYTGQFLDIPRITQHARSLGIFLIWDLAHAVGNMPLSLHDWDVDAAAWCSYKYLNSGPGTIGGLFIHERHGRVSETGAYSNRLSGWWGSSKSSRFQMDNMFHPSEGAAGFQLSNPSIFDITSLCASLEVFAMAGMPALRDKSVKLTGYLESLLLGLKGRMDLFAIITPHDPTQRGAQLSVRLQHGLLDVVMKELEERSVVVDERKPDVIRVAPAPLFNTFMDVFLFVEAFGEALAVAQDAKKKGKNGLGTDELLQTT